jgi:hypothetical protein
MPYRPCWNAALGTWTGGYGWLGRPATLHSDVGRSIKCLHCGSVQYSTWAYARDHRATISTILSQPLLSHMSTCRSPRRDTDASPVSTCPRSQLVSPLAAGVGRPVSAAAWC